MKEVNVVISRKRNIRVTANATAQVIDTKPPVVLKNTPVLETGVNTVDELRDIQLTERQDNSTLVYDSSTDKYRVKPLDFNVIVGDLDGGVF